MISDLKLAIVDRTRLRVSKLAADQCYYRQIVIPKTTFRSVIAAKSLQDIGHPIETMDSEQLGWIFYSRRCCCGPARPSIAE